MAEYVIREAVVDDCDELERLIKEFARHQNMLDDVVLTASQLREDGFGANPLYRCLVAEKVQDTTVNGSEANGKLIAHALYYYHYSKFDGRTLYLEGIYVMPENRNQGIASAMLQRLASIAVAAGCRRLELTCLVWNKPTIEWYIRRGLVDVTNSEQWHLFDLKADNLRRHAAGSSCPSTATGCSNSNAGD